MDKLDKKKRHVSGSRSKSKKSKPNDASVDLKPHKVSQVLNSQQHSSKVKTENSINKSKGSKKYSKYTKKTKLLKTNKNNMDESKQASRSVSAQRKHSLVKMNRTQANFEHQDTQRRIYALKKTLKKIQRPTSIKTKQILNFYRQIQDSIQMVSQPLYSLLCCLHELYIFPISQILDMISPYQHLLQRKQQLSKQVEEQVKHNEQVYSKLTQEQIYIIKLKQTIQQQRQQIQQKKKQQQKRKIQYLNKQQNINFANEGPGESMFKNEGLVRNMKKQKPILVAQKNSDNAQKNKQKQKSRDKQKQKQQKSTVTFKDHSKDQEAQRDSPNSPNPVSNYKKQAKQTSTFVLKDGGLKLDLGLMNKSEAVGFHDQFYSKLDEFSESWRNQALRQKRF